MLWRYIKAKHLQDPSDGRRVLFTGDPMGAVLSAGSAGMTDMPRLLTPHLRSISSSSSGASSSAGAAAAAAAADGPPLEPSPAFAQLLATLEAAAPARVTRKAALRAVGRYAAARHLRDGCTIRCNSRLKALFFGRDEVHVSDVGGLVDRHLRPPAAAPAPGLAPRTATARPPAAAAQAPPADAPAPGLAPRTAPARPPAAAARAAAPAGTLPGQFQASVRRVILENQARAFATAGEPELAAARTAAAREAAAREAAIASRAAAGQAARTPLPWPSPPASPPPPAPPRAPIDDDEEASLALARRLQAEEERLAPVSYTHLTLPTILLV